MKQPIDGKQLSYAYWFAQREPETGLPVPGLGSNRFTVFPKPVRLQAMELTRPAKCLGGRPEQVAISAYSTVFPRGFELFQGNLPWNESDTCRLEFPDVPLLAVSQRCQWRSPVHFDFMEWHPTRYTIPFNIFDGTQWFGELGADIRVPEPPAPPILERGRIEPRGGDGLEAWTDGRFVTYRSRFLNIGFSLIRPRLSFLAWDGMGTGRVDKNFLVDSTTGFAWAPASGPWRRHLGFDLPPMLWGGAVEVDGRRVCYRGLRCLPECTLDVEFDLDAAGFRMHVRQHSRIEQTFLEAEAWRWVWDGRRVYSLSALANPQRRDQRNGIVEPYGGWHCAGQGVLSFTPIGTPPVGMQIDTAGFGNRQAFAGLLLGVRPEPFGPITVLAGEADVTIAFAVGNLDPVLSAGVQKANVHPGLHRAWGTQFAFRPEHAGFSNNSFGVNCKNCLHLAADLAPHTHRQPPLPSMTALLRYSVELAVKGGPGYMCFLEEGHDTAPSLLIAAGRVYQAEQDGEWVRSIWPFLERYVCHIISNLDASGFYICRRLSGNSHSYRASCNSIDTYCCGHADGYSGALAYRGLRNAAVLARVAGTLDREQQCELSAQRLRAAFIPTLLNPATGWLAGWRSADGELHDCALHIVTAQAAIYGILDLAQAREMMSRLERQRLACGADDLRYGLPPNFLPVPARDFWTEGLWARKDLALRQDGADTYGIFINGGLTPCSAGFYLRALSLCGFTDTADRLCDQLLESFDRGVFDGCLNGAECYTFDGMPSGYEGTLTHSYHVLLAIAQHKGWIAPLTPEWWPTAGVDRSGGNEKPQEPAAGKHGTRAKRQFRKD
ncbi:MAG: hypothetical protein PHR35_04195 [Kiritimatiellae bacterium]|nr:hypothetical protein [Kiritimatiellia bacterium]